MPTAVHLGCSASRASGRGSWLCSAPTPTSAHVAAPACGYPGSDLRHSCHPGRNECGSQSPTAAGPSGGSLLVLRPWVLDWLPQLPIPPSKGYRGGLAGVAAPTRSAAHPATPRHPPGRGLIRWLVRPTVHEFRAVPAIFPRSVLLGVAAEGETTCSAIQSSTAALISA